MPSVTELCFRLFPCAVTLTVAVGCGGIAQDDPSQGMREDDALGGEESRGDPAPGRSISDPAEPRGEIPPPPSTEPPIQPPDIDQPPPPPPPAVDVPLATFDEVVTHCTEVCSEFSQCPLGGEVECESDCMVSTTDAQVLGCLGPFDGWLMCLSIDPCDFGSTSCDEAMSAYWDCVDGTLEQPISMEASCLASCQHVASCNGSSTDACADDCANLIQFADESSCMDPLATLFECTIGHPECGPAGGYCPDEELEFFDCLDPSLR
jgi:hypothetical protein